jgi:hypothetical protein
MRASILSVVDEYGQVVDIEITPNDKNDNIKHQLARVFEKIHPNNKPQIIFSDNATQHESAIKEAFKLKFQGEVDVGQDLWHAEMRIIKTLKLSHPDYRMAVQSLKRVYAGIPQQKYSSKEEFATALRAWQLEFEKQRNFSPYEQICSAGTLFSLN